MLKHETDAAVADAVQRRILSAEMDLAAVGPFQAGYDAQQRGLAGAGGTEQGHELTGADFEIDAAERREFVELLGHAVDADGHAIPLWLQRSRITLAISVTSARSARSDATANDAANWYSL